MGDEIGCPDAERVHHAGDVRSLIFLGVACVRMRGQAHAAQIGDNDRTILFQRGRDGRPHIASVAESVQQHDRGAVAADAHV